MFGAEINGCRNYSILVRYKYTEQVLFYEMALNVTIEKSKLYSALRILQFVQGASHLIMIINQRRTDVAVA